MQDVNLKTVKSHIHYTLVLRPSFQQQAQLNVFQPQKTKTVLF